MKYFLLFFLISIPELSIAQNLEIGETEIISDDLKIKRIAENTYLHLSYMETEQYGRIENNGGLVVLHKEAILYDTPHNEEITLELVDWIENQGWVVQGVVASHFHFDGMGGLSVFHKKIIPTYGHLLTPELSYSSEYQLAPPENLFDGKLHLSFGGSRISLEYFGPGHTSDNIILWFPEDRVLFGGCLIKSMRAGTGNLDDANLAEWSNTISKIKQVYVDSINFVIPGHGAHGGVELLDKTFEMFDN